VNASPGAASFDSKLLEILETVEFKCRDYLLRCVYYAGDLIDPYTSGRCKPDPELHTDWECRIWHPESVHTWKAGENNVLYNVQLLLIDRPYIDGQGDGLRGLVRQENQASSHGKNHYLSNLMKNQPGPTYPEGEFFCKDTTHSGARQKCIRKGSKGCALENCSTSEVVHCYECGDDWGNQGRRLIELNQLDAHAPVVALAPTGADSGTSLLWLVALIPLLFLVWFLVRRVIRSMCTAEKPRVTEFVDLEAGMSRDLYLRVD